MSVRFHDKEEIRIGASESTWQGESMQLAAGLGRSTAYVRGRAQYKR